MAEFENLLYEKADGIGTVTINRPKALNALNAATVSELNTLIDEITADHEVKVVIVTGAGPKSFVAGADIKEMQSKSAIEGQ